MEMVSVSDVAIHEVTRRGLRPTSATRTSIGQRTTRAGAASLKRRKSRTSLKFDVVWCTITFGCKLRIVVQKWKYSGLGLRLSLVPGLGLVVRCSGAYRPADALNSHTKVTEFTSSTCKLYLLQERKRYYKY